tara:strand:+ start:16924 stop:18987 length:2064 start_codon:yes stop_codon:yes gene_type:complete
LQTVISLRKPLLKRNPASSVIDLTEAIFAPQGSLKNHLAFDHRPQQEQMAIAVAQALTSDQPLVFEAGTGVGKSLAYLVPSIIQAIESNRQCILSTHTISLQEQLIRKELRHCRRLFSTEQSLKSYGNFRSALLFGRSNYLCPNRLTKALTSQNELFPSTEMAELKRIVDWAGETKEGLLHEITPTPPVNVWEWVNADASSCNRNVCRPDHCFFQKARQRLEEANLIVLNHSLFFSLLRSSLAGDGPGVLFPNDFVILDEAQTIPSIATEQLGIHISSYGLNRLLRRLYNPNNGKGIFSLCGAPSDRKTVEEAIQLSDRFFGLIRQDHLSSQNIVRLYEENWCDPFINPHLDKIIRNIGHIADRHTKESDRVELRDLRNHLTRYRNSITECVELSQHDHVYWLEKTGQVENIVKVRNAPIDVSSQLREFVFSRQTSVIVTSATLAENIRLDSFSEKIGASGYPAEKVTSPFNFSDQMRIFIATDAPAPSHEQHNLDLDFLCDTIRFCSLRVKGGSLVLFTNYQSMFAVAEIIQSSLSTQNRSLFVQSRDGSRSQITSRFAKKGNAILFGTNSFWTGVDVPGSALSQVIITRLPFENPNHPIIDAKCQWIQSNGGNPFTQHTLPEAVLKLRQGVGRLIRNASDRGTITIIDSRILNRPYGKRFLEVLPLSHHIPFSCSNRSEVFVPLV